MSDKLFERAYELQKHIKAAKDEIKEAESELNDIIKQIRKDNIESFEYCLEPLRTPEREADLEWFRANEPDFYNRYAHVSHAVAVSIMSDVCGGYEEFQERLREGRQAFFTKNATLNIKDIETVFGEQTTKDLESIGAIIRAEPKSFKVSLLSTFMSEAAKKKATSGGA